MAEIEKIGIVVIGRNEGDRLKRCLWSIPKGAVTVYVDSGSTDQSVPFALSQDAQVVRLDLTRPFTAARARNEGAEELLKIAPHVEFIQFIDGDCELELGWLEMAHKYLLDEPQVGVVCGRRRERFPEDSFYNQVIDDEWNTPIGEANSCGGDAMYRRIAFEAVRGFDAAMIAGEEPELCGRMRAAGWTVWRVDCPMTIHDAALERFSQWWVRAVRSGFGYAQVWMRSRKGSIALYGREVARATFWTVGILGVAFLLLAIIGPTGLLIAPAAWALQWARLSVRSGPRKAALLVIGKFAEFYGVLRFLVARTSGRRSGAILYK